MLVYSKKGSHVREIHHAASSETGAVWVEWLKRRKSREVAARQFVVRIRSCSLVQYGRGWHAATLIVPATAYL